MALRCVVVGNVNVGKSEFIAFCQRKFGKQEDQPGDDSILWNRDGMSTEMVFTEVNEDDTTDSKAEKFAEADVFLLCYAVDDRDSLTSLQTKWGPEIREYCPATPLFLTALKSDIRQYNPECTSYGEGTLTFRKMGAKGWLECSVKHGIGVELVITFLVKHGLAFSKAKAETMKTSDGEFEATKCCQIM